MRTLQIYRDIEEKRPKSLAFALQLTAMLSLNMFSAIGSSEDYLLLAALIFNPISILVMIASFLFDVAVIWIVGGKRLITQLSLYFLLLFLLTILSYLSNYWPYILVGSSFVFLWLTCRLFVSQSFRVVPAFLISTLLLFKAASIYVILSSILLFTIGINIPS